MIPSELDAYLNDTAQGYQTRARAIGRIPLPSLRLRVSERRLLLVLVDLLLINGSLALALWLRSDIGRAYVWALPRWYVVLSFIWLGCAIFFDVYNLSSAAHPPTAVRRILGASLAATLIYTLTPILTPPLGARSQTFLFVSIGCAVLPIWRLLYALLFVQPGFSQQALVVGAGQAGRELATALSQGERIADSTHISYELAGYIDANPAHWETTICDAPVFGGHNLLLPLVKRLAVDEVVLAITHRHNISEDLLDALVQCTEQGVRVTTMSLVYERLFGRVPVDHLGNDLPRLLNMEESVVERVYAGIRRLADIVLAIPVLLVLGAVMPVILAANALTSPGAAFYRQRRVGRGGRLFDIIKLRTMIPDAEKASGPVWAELNDPRITPIGRWLRRTRLDELPQAINVLRGEMSFIGPRPERPEFVEELAKELPFYRTRHAIRPGLTGWAQVQYRYANSVDDARIKLEYDLYYIKHYGPLLDLQILVKTLAVMLRCRGA